MLPENIKQILLKYADGVTEEISTINKSIDRIKDSLSTVNSIVINELSAKAKNQTPINESSELELLKDSQYLREYISQITNIEINYNKKKLTVQNKCLDIHDIIVINSVKSCSQKAHTLSDVKVKIPVLYENSDVVQINVTISYCQDCDKYIMLKDDYARITGIIMCQVIDETVKLDNFTHDNLINQQKKSILYNYGYNVSAQNNLSDKNRHIILASVIEANILTRIQVEDHLQILIDRGSKIPSWGEAVQKWKRDKYFIQNYKTEKLPEVIFDKIILKYKISK